MSLKQIFSKSIARAIEGVIKADDQSSLQNELEEYVITNEVEARLQEVLDTYNHYAGANGVWISGFFGSGKSHLLKMLALLLENRTIGGKSTLDYFLEKCQYTNNGAFLEAALKQAVAKPSRSILFNIDQKSDVKDKTQTDAILGVFMKVFNEMCGYFGEQSYVAHFERDLDNDGKYAAFKEIYKAQNGRDWENDRAQIILRKNQVDKAYSAITGQEQKGIVDGYRTTDRLSIEEFGDLVKQYIDAQGKDFRLNFFVDEVGQYIANHSKLMVNLQTIAETLATKCQGRVWVFVTTQEDMDTVLGEMSKQQSNDFSKIQDRFKLRMKLTSTNVSEVIQTRLLAKTEDSKPALASIYEKQQNNFKTLFDFVDGSRRFGNFKDEDNFIRSYPFIPYQFDLFQSCIEKLSKSNAFEGKHSSVGERSMLGVF